MSRDSAAANVVRRMFDDVEADVSTTVEGDDTYDASTAPSMVNDRDTGGAPTHDQRCPRDRDQGGVSPRAPAAKSRVTSGRRRTHWVWV